MRYVFADSFYFLAILNPRDSAHGQAILLSEELSGRPLLTTEAVLLEVADALCRPPAREGTADYLRHLRVSSTVTVIPGGEELFEEGLDLYEARSDKNWSLTDCISFVVMEREGVTEALTGDRQFAQAGFQPLF